MSRKLLGALLIVLATTAAASVVSGQTMNASIQPTVLGEVTAVSSHTVSVNSIDGEAMDFEIDSRSVVPVDLAPGTRVDIEFHLLSSGIALARRVTPLTAGSAEWDAFDQRTSSPHQAAAERGPARTRTDAAAASTQPPSSSKNAVSDGSTTDAVANADPSPSSSSASADPSTESGTSEDDMADTLPATAGHGAWILIIGLMAMSAALGMWFSRWRSASR